MNQKEFIKSRLHGYSKLIDESKVIETLNRYGFTDCKITESDEDYVNISCKGSMDGPNSKFTEDLNSVVGSIDWEGYPNLKINDRTEFNFYRDEGTYSKLNTYSWKWLFTTVGQPLINALVNAIAGKIKFILSKDKSEFDALIEKFRKSTSPEESEKYWQRIQYYMNKSENKKEVKDKVDQVIKENKEKFKKV